MKSLALAFCALLLVASASAQTVSPVLSLETSTPPEPVPAGGSTEAVLELQFQCPNQTEVQPDDWVVTTEFTLPDGFHAEASQPDPIPGDTCLTEPVVARTVTLSLHVPADAEPAKEYPIEVSLRAVPDGDSPLSDASNELRTAVTVAIEGAPQEENENETLEPAADDGEDAPGPALPLLLGLLAVVASVRRRGD